jgi:hypothetical protein
MDLFLMRGNRIQEEHESWERSLKIFVSKNWNCRYYILWFKIVPTETLDPQSGQPQSLDDRLMCRLELESTWSTGVALLIDDFCRALMTLADGKLNYPPKIYPGGKFHIKKKIKSWRKSNRQCISVCFSQTHLSTSPRRVCQLLHANTENLDLYKCAGWAGGRKHPKSKIILM